MKTFLRSHLRQQLPGAAYERGDHWASSSAPGAFPDKDQSGGRIAGAEHDLVAALVETAAGAVADVAANAFEGVSSGNDVRQFDFSHGWLFYRLRHRRFGCYLHNGPAMQGLLRQVAIELELGAEVVRIHEARTAAWRSG